MPRWPSPSTVPTDIRIYPRSRPGALAGSYAGEVDFTLTVLDGVRWHGEPVSGIRPQLLLSALVRAGGRSVGAARLVAEVWGDHPPADASKALQVLVSRTRTVTGAEVIERSQDGYRLGLTTDQVDAPTLAGAVEQVRTASQEGRTAQARELAESALTIAVQQPDPDQPGAPNELRQAAASHRRELTGLLGLALSHSGNHGAAVATLEPTAEDSGDETLIAALLHSEAASRSAAAALDRYERYRRDLADRLGSDPGPELQRTHAHLLALDQPVRDGVQYEPTPLIGRDDDVADVLGLLQTARLVSIVGPGGLGKTRLAHAVSRQASQPVVQLVELVGISSDDEVIIEVASALGVRDSVTSRRSLTPEQRSNLHARVAEQLSGAPTLLIIDNCEHVIDGVARLISLLIANIGELDVLTTSRAPLGVAAERSYQLPQLSRADGMALFNERATAARPGVRLDDGLVGDLVDRLDGLPLAVELAAARTRVMSVAEIAGGLADRFSLLRGRDRTASKRHRTLEGVIDWSWSLLGKAERRALSRLATFRDGFSRSGAAALIGHDPLPALESLADQSLLVVEEDNSIRYRMLETVREFGLLQLDRAGNQAKTQQLLRNWAFEECRRVLGSLYGPDQYIAVDWLWVEEGNLNEILRQAIADRDREAVVVLTAALSDYWRMIGDHQRVVALSSAVLDLLTDYTPPAEFTDQMRAVLANLLINAVIYFGDPGIDLYQRELQRLGAADDPRVAGLNRALLVLGHRTIEDQIDQLSRMAYAADREQAVQTSEWLCHLLENEGDPQAAIAVAENGLRLCRESDGPWIRAALLNERAELGMQNGDWETAEHNAREALPILERLHAHDDAAGLRGLLVMTAIRDGRLDEAGNLLHRLRHREPRTTLAGGANTAVAAAEAELQLARGDIAGGLQAFRDELSRMRSIRIPQLGSSDYAPWLLFTESVALAALHRYGAEADAGALYQSLLAKCQSYLSDEATFTDYPIAGTMLFALATRLSPSQPEMAARLAAFAQAFSVVKTVPSIDTDGVSAAIEAMSPGAMAAESKHLAGQRPRDLQGRAHELICEIATATSLAPSDREPATPQ